jgi:hypothetical protein
VHSCERPENKPSAYLRDVLDRVSTHPTSRVDDLLPSRGVLPKAAGWMRAGLTADSVRLPIRDRARATAPLAGAELAEPGGWLAGGGAGLRRRAPLRHPPPPDRLSASRSHAVSAGVRVAD